VFTDISTVQGTGSIGIANSASVSDTGKLASYFSPAIGSTLSSFSGLSTNRSFSFSLGSLNNEEFLRGFLTNTAMDDVILYLRSRNPPKELIASLLIDSIEIAEYVHLS
jgi:hypothetical protein